MKSETPAGPGLENSDVASGSDLKSTALITSCVEVDLRGLGKMQPDARRERARWAAFSLDGIAPGDVVKVIVDRDSFFCFHGIDFRGVRIQITANDVHTRKRWEQQFAEVTS